MVKEKEKKTDGIDDDDMGAVGVMMKKERKKSSNCFYGAICVR
jgi:hypothetical protein